MIYLSGNNPDQEEIENMIDVSFNDTPATHAMAAKDNNKKTTFLENLKL